LRNPRRDPKPLAHELYTILIGPVKADLDQAKAETLVWSLDGVLRYVPIARSTTASNTWWRTYNTVTITPASIAHLGEKPDVSKLGASAMGIAHKYEAGLPALPAVAVELDDVVKDPKVEGANGALPGTILLDGQFTESAMEKQLDGRPGVVHIASHFVFKPGDDSQSYLLLAGKDECGVRVSLDGGRLSRQQEPGAAPHRPADAFSVRDGNERKRKQRSRGGWTGYDRATEGRPGGDLVAVGA
jgi:CHAT domain-containing protein